MRADDGFKVDGILIIKKRNLYDKIIFNQRARGERNQILISTSKVTAFGA
jgi:hypothetical protein